MMERVVILGMNNPLSADPARALWPEPAGVSGWHLWKLTEARTGATQTDYLRSFHRINLTLEWVWDPRTAADEWVRMERDIVSTFDVIIVLGASVRRALGLSMGELDQVGKFYSLPHPSGLNRWYNSPANRACAEILMEEMYRRANGLYM